MIRITAFLAAFSLLLFASAKRPDFKDFSVDVGFTGSPAAPRLTTSWSQRYRTQIRRGVASQQGFRKGSEYIETAGPNFAGHYRVVNWGCGSGCLMMVIVDLKTGTIYPPPMSAAPTGAERITIPNLGTGWGGFDFRVDSRLFVMKTCPWGSPDPNSPFYRGTREFCGTTYFTIEPQGFRMIQRVHEELIPAPD